jgi:predicted DNA-binding ArsR family transcriptional regulator
MSFFTNPTIEQLAQKGSSLLSDIAVQDTNFKLASLARTQDSIHSVIPIMVQSTEKVKKYEKELEYLIQDAHEVCDQIRQMGRIESFYSSIELLQRHIQQK